MPADLRQPSRRHGPGRRAFFRAVESACALCGGRRFYRRRHLRAGRFVVREEELAVAGLRAGLDGFTLVQLSDLHAGPFLRAEDLADVLAAVARAAPDACVLTGDFVTHRAEDALGLAGALGGIQTRHGTFAVFGNHDYRGRQEGRIEAAFAAHGIRCLRNACARIDTGDGVLGLVGLEDLEEGRTVDLAGAREGLVPGDLELVLCHNPQAARSIARPGCAAILSGHTHGGQLDVAGLRRLGPAHPGLRLALGETTLIVNRGLGVLGVPLRVGAPAEIVRLRLRAVGGAPELPVPRAAARA